MIQFNTLPAQSFGLNLRDGRPGMDFRHALKLINLLPTNRGLELRRGSRIHQTGMNGAAVETLAIHNGSGGTNKFLAMADNKFWDVTSQGGTPSDITGTTTPTTDRWYWVQMAGYTLFFNGSDTPQEYDGTTLQDVSSYTGSGLTASNLIFPCVHKNRLFIAEENSLTFWYGNTLEYKGALTKDETLQYIVKEGGYLLWMASWSRDGGAGERDLMVFCTSEGEIVVYQGNGPDDTTTPWQLVLRARIPTPLGRRSVIELGTELIILTERGAIPLSNVAENRNNEAGYTSYTDLVDEGIKNESQLYGSNFGWCGAIYPNGGYAVINIPTVENSSAIQYVVNTLTGAWTTFTNLNAITWQVFNKKLYFSSGDGVVYEADFGSNDNEEAIPFECATAFTTLSGSAYDKLPSLVKPAVESSSALSLKIDVSTDFILEPPRNEVSIVGTAGEEWDVAEWDVAEWDGAEAQRDDWFSLEGLGRTISITFKGTAKDTSFAISGWMIGYEDGGML